MTDYSNSNYYDPNRGFRVWNRTEIVQIAGQTDKFVPNIDDMVLDWDQGWFRVTDVEQGTWLSTLEKWTPPTGTDTDGEENVLVGVGPGYSSESYRCFLDTTVTPHTLSPDSRLHWYGSMVSSYKVFKGSDISEEFGTIISAYYDNSGNYLGTSVPVEALTIPDAVQDTIKVPMTGFTSVELDDGERITLVCYDDEGGVISYAQLLVMNTQAIRQADSTKSYVEGISIDSAFISESDPKVIEFPMNVTVDSLPMQGLVKYKGGKIVRLAMGDAQFSILGLENYIATQADQEFPLTLVYKLADDEISYQLAPTSDRSITENYIARTTPVDGSYECRLFVYPVWVSATAGYRLEFFLMNVDRQQYWNVTNYVELGVNSAPYNPVSYGTVQSLTYAVNLNKVDGRFLPFRFVANFQIALLQSGETQANWVVYPRPDASTGYGRGLMAEVDYVQTNIWDLRIDNGASSYNDWLTKLYTNAEPLVNSETEETPPNPTHFQLEFLYNTYEFSVTQWNDVLKVNNDLKTGELVYINWISRQYDTDLYLARTALPIYQTS